ncbi:uncharacterized protein N7484_007133, partial [Penicillium longicatenatum]|uniref:uncharacterized protein n=1 Tax=Penicillium longicatenatum TaxID=1561947 RepID=UPI00254665F8
MQVAEILSDITSLRVCGHNEALSLVNVNQPVTRKSDTDKDSSAVNASDEAPGTQDKKHEDLQRAKELVKLHYEFKSRHSNGEVDDALRKAREDVELVLSEL